MRQLIYLVATAEEAGAAVLLLGFGIVPSLKPLLEEEKGKKAH